DLVDPARKRVCSRRGDLQARAFCRGYQFSPRAVHFNAQIADAVANPRARFDDGLVQLGLDLFDDVRRGLGNELADVRTQFASRRIDDLEFFFDANSEAVSHGLALRGARADRDFCASYHTPPGLEFARFKRKQTNSLRIAPLAASGLFRRDFRSMIRESS